MRTVTLSRQPGLTKNIFSVIKADKVKIVSGVVEFYYLKDRRVERPYDEYEKECRASGTEPMFSRIATLVPFVVWQPARAYKIEDGVWIDFEGEDSNVPES